MITGIAIENFKGIRERVEIELRPITLLFGANSAGKSTILHALHYAREIFERHNLDADQTIAGGKYIDLGGFEHFIHRRDQEDVLHSQKQIRLRIDLDVAAKDLPSFDAEINGLVRQSVEEVDRHESKIAFEDVRGLLDLDFHSLLTEISNAAVEIAIGWSSVENCPFVASTTILFNNVEFARIVANPNMRGVAVKFSKTVPDPADDSNLIEISTLDHPCLKRAKEAWQGDDQQNNPYGSETLLQLALTHCDDLLSASGDRIELSGRGDALPGLNGPLTYDLEPFSPTGDEEHDTRLAFKINLAGQLVYAVSDLIVGPCQIVRDQLMMFRYLGPLRDTPPRNYQPPRFPDPSRWSSGLGAWDALQNGSDGFVLSVANWLGDEDKLNSGYRVERRNFKEVDLANPLITKLLTGRAFDEADEDARLSLAGIPTLSRLVVVPQGSELELQPHDVGIGISQVVPVVVTALEGERRLLAIEQSELHLHPKLQAELGDLFVEAALGRRRHLIILETHSEHLILRLLRRIRETTDGELPEDKHPLEPDDVAVYFIEATPSGAKETRLRIDPTGDFVDRWPKGFFEERAKELF